MNNQGPTQLNISPNSLSTNGPVNIPISQVGSGGGNGGGNIAPQNISSSVNILVKNNQTGQTHTMPFEQYLTNKSQFTPLSNTIGKGNFVKASDQNGNIGYMWSGSPAQGYTPLPSNQQVNIPHTFQNSQGNWLTGLGNFVENQIPLATGILGGIGGSALDEFLGPLGSVGGWGVGQGAGTAFRDWLQTALGQRHFANPGQFWGNVGKGGAEGLAFGAAGPALDVVGSGLGSVADLARSALGKDALSTAVDTGAGTAANVAGTAAKDVGMGITGTGAHATMDSNQLYNILHKAAEMRSGLLKAMGSNALASGAYGALSQINKPGTTPQTMEQGALLSGLFGLGMGGLSHSLLEPMVSKLSNMAGNAFDQVGTNAPLTPTERILNAIHPVQNDTYDAGALSPLTKAAKGQAGKEPVQNILGDASNAKTYIHNMNLLPEVDGSPILSNPGLSSMVNTKGGAIAQHLDTLAQMKAHLLNTGSITPEESNAFLQDLKDQVNKVEGGLTKGNANILRGNIDNYLTKTPQDVLANQDTATLANLDNLRADIGKYANKTGWKNPNEQNLINKLYGAINQKMGDVLDRKGMTNVTANQPLMDGLTQYKNMAVNPQIPPEGGNPSDYLSMINQHIQALHDVNRNASNILDAGSAPATINAALREKNNFLKSQTQNALKDLNPLQQEIKASSSGKIARNIQKLAVGKSLLTGRSAYPEIMATKIAAQGILKSANDINSNPALQGALINDLKTVYPDAVPELEKIAQDLGVSIKQAKSYNSIRYTPKNLTQFLQTLVRANVARNAGGTGANIAKTGGL